MSLKITILISLAGTAGDLIDAILIILLFLLNLQEQYQVYLHKMIPDYKQYDWEYE